MYTLPREKGGGRSGLWVLPIEVGEHPHEKVPGAEQLELHLKMGRTYSSLFFYDYDFMENGENKNIGLSTEKQSFRGLNPAEVWRTGNRRARLRVRRCGVRVRGGAERSGCSRRSEAASRRKEARGWAHGRDSEG